MIRRKDKKEFDSTFLSCVSSYVEVVVVVVEREGNYSAKRAIIL